MYFTGRGAIAWRRLRKRLVSVLLFTRKTKLFNKIVFSVGQRYVIALRIWFSLGAVFGALAMLSSVMLLGWQSLRNLHSWSVSHDSVAEASIVVAPAIPGVNLPWSDTVYISLATTLAVGFHELGHALAAGSEGVPTEHVALFILLIFSGALVALNEDSFNLLSHMRRLRIYCAGIWHNAALSVLCWLCLRLLPIFLLPIYVYDIGPVVRDVELHSTLAGHLRKGDVLKAIDYEAVYSTKDWDEKLQSIVGRDVCVPVGMVASPCTTGMLQFHSLNSSSSEKLTCLDASKIGQLRRCGAAKFCLQTEECMEAQLPPGDSLIRISFVSSSNSTCTKISSEELLGSPCEKTIIFAGHPQAVAHSLHLTNYLPRYGFIPGWISDVLEKFLAYTLSVSAALAILNSLPVFYLDGQEILYSLLSLNPRWLHYKRRQKVSKACLFGGTMLLLFAVCSGIAKQLLW